MSPKTVQLFLKVALLTLFFLCVWLTYHLFDQSITLDHQIQYSDIIEKQKNVLVNILNHTGTNISESDIRKVLAKVYKETFFEKQGDCIVANQVSFFFSNGKLIRVEAGKQ